MVGGVHLLGEKMISRLRLNHEKVYFEYKDPTDGSVKECGGMLQILISVDRDNHEVNKLPFLPMKIKEQGSLYLRTFRATCEKCVKTQHKGLCPHQNSQRIWRGVYTCEEIAYACSVLKYNLITIEEALVYPQKAYIFADFMKILASKKIKYGKVPEEYKNNLSQYCQEINDSMNFDNDMDKLTPDLLEENPYQCAFIKG